MHGRIRAVSVGTAMALLMTACGGSEPAASSSNGATDAIDATGMDAAVGPTAPAGIEINEDSPIESLLGVPLFDDDAMNAWFRELDVERQTLTAECMLAEGFQFTPETTPAPAGPEGALSTSSREYAENFGFGIVSSFNESTYDPAKDYSTANSRYLASLSEGEVEAYYIALRGQPDIVEPDNDTFAPGGCEGRAFEEVFTIVAVMDELTPVADTYFQQFISDSRTIALYETWQRCMSEAGYTSSVPDEVAEPFFFKLDRIISDDGSFEPVDIPDEVPEPGFVFSGDVFGVHPRLTGDAQQQLDDLAAEEIATAVAAWDCRSAIIDDELAVQREYEAKLVDEIAPTVAERLGD